LKSTILWHSYSCWSIEQRHEYLFLEMCMCACVCYLFIVNGRQHALFTSNVVRVETYTNRLVTSLKQVNERKEEEKKIREKNYRKWTYLNSSLVHYILLLFDINKKKHRSYDNDWIKEINHRTTARSWGERERISDYIHNRIV
jgi:hypothetical protein